MKTCPVCNSRCFDDMETCYGCMYSFKNNSNEKHIKNSSTNKLRTTKNIIIDDEITKKHIPEFFELEPFSYIEETDKNLKKAAHAKKSSIAEEDIVVKIKIPKSVLEKYLQ